MELLDDVCHMESRFDPFGVSVSLGARLVYSLRLMHYSLRNHFGCTCMLGKGDASRCPDLHDVG